MANAKEIADIVALISAAYPNFNPTQYTVEVYYKLLGDIPGDTLKAAALHCTAENGRKFAPSVGELRGAVLQIQKISLDVPSSYEAWEETQKQILENGGDYGTPVWSHPLVEKTVRAIGWRHLRMGENQEADRARFIQCYEQFSAKSDIEEMMLPEVQGYIEVNKQKMLAPTNQMKQLTKKLSVPKRIHPHTGEVLE